MDEQTAGEHDCYDRRWKDQTKVQRGRRKFSFIK